MKNTKHTSMDRRWSRFIPGPFLLAGLVAVGLIAWGAHGMHAMQTANAAAPASPAPELVREADAIVVPAASPLRRTLVVAPVQSQSLAAPFVLPATVEADPARLVKITTPMAGRVVRLEKQLEIGRAHV